MFGIARLLSQMGQITDEMTLRQAYIAALTEAAARAAGKPHFNIDLEMNDLWIVLGNIKAKKSQSLGVGTMATQVLNGLAPVTHSLGRITEQMLQGLAK